MGVGFRLRTPTIVRPEERSTLDKWLGLDLPLLSGHLGLVAELAAEGRDVVADYGVNCFNSHTAAEFFRLGAARIVASIELTAGELGDARGTVARRRFRRVGVRTTGRDDDRALRAFGRVRARGDHLS